MADARTLTAEVRTEFGKGAARRTRRDGRVPAVMYGHGGDPRHVSLDGHSVMLALKGGGNALLTIEFPDGVSEMVLARQIVRDPIRGFYKHLDLLVVRKGERVNVEIAIHLEGEAAPETIVDQQLTTLSVEADATEIPSSVTISIEGLQVGDRHSAGEITLPAGVTLLSDPEQVVVQGIAPQAEEAEPETEGDEAAEGEQAEGAESAEGGDSATGEAAESSDES